MTDKPEPSDFMTGSDKRQNAETIDQLAAQAKHGDPQALEGLLTHPTLSAVVGAIACRMVGPEQADDIIQEVLLRVAQKLHTWQGTAKITNWVCQITVNCCYDVQQKTDRDDEAQRHWAVLTDIWRDDTPAQTRYMDTLDKTEIVRQTLASMKGSCRQIMHLYLFEGLPKQDIMEQLELTKSSFYSRWKRCCATLTQKIQDLLTSPQNS